MNQQTQGIIRHILSALGALLIAFGWLDVEAVSEGTELVLIGIGFVTETIAFYWSYISKKGGDPTILQDVNDMVKANLEAAVIHNGTIQIKSELVKSKFPKLK